MNVFGSKLTKRYLSITLIVIFFTLSFLYWLTIRVMEGSFSDQIAYRDELIARTLSKRISDIIQSMTSDLRVASAYVLKVTEKNRDFYLSEMERMVVQQPLYLSIQAFNSEGKIVVKVPDAVSLDAKSFEDLHNYLSWSKTYYISDMITLEDGRKSIAIAYPSIDENGMYKGGVVAFVNLEMLSEYLKELKIGELGVNAIIDRNGTIIGHSELETIGFSLKEHPIRDYLNKEKFGIWEGSLFHQHMIAAYRPLSMIGFGLIVGEPIKQAMQSSIDVRILLLKGFTAVLFIAAGLTVFWTNRVVRPIIQLMKQVKEYNQNKQKNFEPIKTNDEIEELSRTMGQMAGELKENERRMFYILESIPYAIITTDKNGKITTFNRGAEELTLFSREEAIGRNIIDLPIKENKDVFLSWKTLQEGKEFDDVESYIFDKNKKKHDVKIHSSLYHGEGNKVVGTIIVIRDVSHIKKLEEYLRQSERLASLGQLTAGIAHEIKNPLSIVQAAAEAISMEIKELQFENSIITELTNDILETSQRMNQLLVNFLKLSKGEEDNIKETINVIAVIDELLSHLRKKMKDQGIQVIKQYAEKKVYVLANQNGLTQVFLNILINSMQAMEQGGTLLIKVEKFEKNCMVQIEDSGVGIPASKLPWIFNPFFSTKREGTGLGLSIAHEIIVQHNGKIWAESVEGSGTSLYVQLPRLEQIGDGNEKNLIG
ncbi:histidine kinase [Aeribacillus pallidus]|uniref:PAS domain-containing sensor histidine kinase n=2 Tax=Aeribacillus TaxID=1055323 RepID=UPI0007B4D8AB|nr:PAS domain-containing sensor histidine kinase [Aeribacillus pallidus]KZM57057.1 histidine kinase [Aeribacillus pallidus]